jgi:carboxylate-amine ligase
MTETLNRLGTLVARDAAALDCEREIRHLNTIACLGTSSDVQLALYRRGRECMGTRETALGKVVDWLSEATTAEATPATASRAAEVQLAAAKA